MRLGVLGGGQLARMLALAAAPLGVRVRAYDPSPDACAGDVCELVVGRYDDHATLREFADGLDTMTYEFENVPTGAADLLASLAPVRPGTESLRLSQDRVLEKRALTDAGFEVAPWRQIDTEDDLHGSILAIGAPAILKTRRGGYDGKGQAIIAENADAARAWASIEGRPAILESMLKFNRELSLVAARGLDGSMAFYPLVENEHRQGILRVTIAPAPGVDAGLQRQAEAMAERLMSSLDHVGMLTIEFFEIQGQLIANEFAPRVHNSGHWTIDGAQTSQFENHIRAVLGMPLGPTTVRTPTVMLNCVGAMPDPAGLLAEPSAKLHDYRKPARPGRKVGHVNLLGLDPTHAHDAAKRLGIDLG
ncbi:MAG: 5-(carboxyamino)imidazole ribonucleotide synthase [Phycisphaera sp.]|nr:MAG: 5-(carboxyamino)imidazole ribonucleotide synthase [Phycisphaera sp.]